MTVTRMGIKEKQGKTNNKRTFESKRVSFYYIFSSMMHSATMCVLSAQFSQVQELRFKNKRDIFLNHKPVTYILQVFREYKAKSKVI